MDTLVVTPMQEELDHFLRACTRRGFGATAGTLGRLAVSHLPGLGLTLARGGTGKAQFALQTQHLLDSRPDWERVVCAGAAGALVDDVAIGDVVVATATVEHDYDSRFNDRSAPSFAGAPAAIESLRRVQTPGAFEVHFAIVASGDEDIVEPARRNTLHQATDAWAVAWEGAGGARACTFSRVPFVEIRGITDAADHLAPAHFEANLAAAMSHVADLMLAWILGA